MKIAILNSTFYGLARKNKPVWQFNYKVRIILHFFLWSVFSRTIDVYEALLRSKQKWILIAALEDGRWKWDQGKDFVFINIWIGFLLARQEIKASQNRILEGMRTIGMNINTYITTKYYSMNNNTYINKYTQKKRYVYLREQVSFGY